MYGFLIGLHNVLAWVVLGLGGFLLYRAATARATWSDAETGWLRKFTLLAHTQLLAGLALWVVSPRVTEARAAMGAAMKDPASRRLVVEHPALMLTAVIAATITGVLVKRAPDAAAKAGRALTGLVVTFLAIAFVLPWGRLVGAWAR